jgi:uncharacterized protein DUF6335
MAKPKARKARGTVRNARKRTVRRGSAKRPTVRAKMSRKSRKTPKARKPAKSARARTRAAKSTRATAKPRPPAKVPRLDRARRTLEDVIIPTPPSSLNMDRRGSAARTGRAEIAESIRQHHGMTDVAGGDVDVDVEDAFFTGEEAPGGDNPTPDQDIVDDIGKALGVEYEDNEELKAADKVSKRDKHRWELDPASSEDYKERD